MVHRVRGIISSRVQHGVALAPPYRMREKTACVLFLLPRLDGNMALVLIPFTPYLQFRRAQKVKQPGRVLAVFRPHPFSWRLCYVRSRFRFVVPPWFSFLFLFCSGGDAPGAGVLAATVRHGRFPSCTSSMTMAKRAGQFLETHRMCLVRGCTFKEYR